MFKSWEVKQFFATWSEFHNKWYIVGYLLYCEDMSCNDRYIYPDLSIREVCNDPLECGTGYYVTREEAEQVLSRFINKGNIS